MKHKAEKKQCGAWLCIKELGTKDPSWLFFPAQQHKQVSFKICKNHIKIDGTAHVMLYYKLSIIQRIQRKKRSHYRSECSCILDSHAVASTFFKYTRQVYVNHQQYFSDVCGTANLRGTIQRSHNSATVKFPATLFLSMNICSYHNLTGHLHNMTPRGLHVTSLYTRQEF